VDARRKPQQAEAARLGGVIRVHRGGGRTEDHHGVGLARAHQRQVARVVTRVLFLFVRSVLLLVHHDEAEPGQRGQHRRARPQDDARLAAAGAAPFVEPLSRAEARVEDGQVRSKTRLEAARQQRCQRDLRHQVQCLAPACQTALDRPQVHFCLAAARHPHQEEYAVGAPVQRRVDLVQRRGLLDGRCRRGRWIHRGGNQRRPTHLLPADPDQLLFDQRGHGLWNPSEAVVTLLERSPGTAQFFQ
jgi:hypothetical protein